MLVPGTQMHWVTFCFVCIEVVILISVIVHRFARPDDKNSLLNSILVILLIVYNLTGGLLPDPKLPGSYFVQNCIAYATGFITPCYFPYYVYKAFGLSGMKFHAYRGVYLFLVLPYLLFVAVFGISGNLETAKNLLILPVAYAIWVIYSLRQSIQITSLTMEERTVLFLSITPWVGVPVIDFFSLGQPVEAVLTNVGFLLLLALHVQRNIRQLKLEHERLIASEKKLQSWNEVLQEEVDKRTQELDRLSAEERFIQSCTRYQLTKREQEIARLVCEGQTHKQAGEVLFIAERTVAKHVQNVFEKTGASNKIELCKKLGL
jgi:DNA-binding CsgD family transcriptional regulator